MKVYVTVSNLSNTINIFADDEANKITLNSKAIDYNAVDFISRISMITFNWPTTNINNSVIDGEQYEIRLIANNNQERKIIGKNSFPSNYVDFSQLIHEVSNYGC